MDQNTTQTNASSNVIVVDSIMGSGKSSWAIQTMNDCPKREYFNLNTNALHSRHKPMPSISFVQARQNLHCHLRCQSKIRCLANT